LIVDVSDNVPSSVCCSTRGAGFSIFADSMHAAFAGYTHTGLSTVPEARILQTICLRTSLMTDSDFRLVLLMVALNRQLV
jgi:hypothetical protein